jgi:mono/diheme cytochrome c family protein
MPAALLHFSSLLRSQHNYVRAMPALKFQQNLRQNRSECHRSGTKSAPLALSASLSAPDARNFVEVVLNGINPAPQGSSDRTMPARAIQIGNEDLAALAAFTRQRFGPGGAWTNIDKTVEVVRNRLSEGH